jgi:hypothetical protein
MIMATVAAGAALAFSGTAWADELTSFHTPSNNIHCMGIVSETGNAVDCELLQMDNTKPLLPQPADCDLDWGSRFAVGETGGGYMVCAGDTVRDPNGITLAYGKTFELRGLTCTSSEKGLDCRNGEGHGFFLSRARQELF